MTNLGVWKKAGVVLVLCAATAIAARGQSYKITDLGLLPGSYETHANGGSGEALAENAAGLADFACGVDEGDEGAKAGIQAENRATAGARAIRVVAPFSCRSVEDSAGCLNQC
jgi:hypothetical protein